MSHNQFLSNELLSGKNKLVGNSQPFNNVIKTVNQIAANESSIFINGESGKLRGGDDARGDVLVGRQWKFCCL